MIKIIKWKPLYPLLTLFVVAQCLFGTQSATANRLATVAPHNSGACHNSITDFVDQEVDKAMTSQTIPGMTIAITKDGRLICNLAYGFANYAEQTPMQVTSRAQIGSTTKVLTTLAMMHVIENNPGIDQQTSVYGSNGILSDSDYSDAYVQGIRRHYPIVGMAIGNNNRTITWYSDGTYTIGSSSDLDQYVAPQDFSLPTGRTMAELIGIARGGPNNYVYSWYRNEDEEDEGNGQYSIGTPDDLDAYETGSFKSNRRDKIVGIAVNTSGSAFYAYYHDGTVTSGSSAADLTDRWDNETRTYIVPGDQSRRYDIVGVARSTNENMLAWYSDDQASRGNATDLGAQTDLYAVERPSIPGSRSNWIAEYEQMEIRHLLSHTAGFTRSGQAAQGAIKYDFPAFDEDTNPLPYKDTHRYVLSTRPLLFEVGSNDSYSNHGMGLVGHLIEEITGQDWYDYLHENILDPAHANFILPRGLSSNPLLDSYPHFVNSDGNIITADLEYRTHSGSAAGSLKGTAADLARVMVATDQLSNHPDVLDPSTLDLMESRPFPDTAGGRAHGWGINCSDETCTNRKLTHNGQTGYGTAYIAKYQGHTVNAKDCNADSTGQAAVAGVNIAIVANSGDVSTTCLARLANTLAVHLADMNFAADYDLFAGPLDWSDPDTTGWLSLRNQSESAFNDSFDQYKSAYTPIDIEVDINSNNQRRIGSVWQADSDSRGWLLHYKQTETQFNEKLAAYHDAGYRLVDQEVYRYNGRLYYAGIWHQNVEGFRYITYRDVNSSTFSDNFDTYKADYMMIDFDVYTYNASGENRLAAVWVEKTSDIGWKMRRAMDAATFDTWLDDNEQLGYRALKVESYTVNGEQRYGAILVENRANRNWAIYRDMSGQGFHNRWTDLRAAGLRLIDYERYLLDGNVRYAGVWRQVDEMTPPRYDLQIGNKTFTYAPIGNASLERVGQGFHVNGLDGSGRNGVLIELPPDDTYWTQQLEPAIEVNRDPSTMDIALLDSAQELIGGLHMEFSSQMTQSNLEHQMSFVPQWDVPSGGYRVEFLYDGRIVDEETRRDTEPVALEISKTWECETMGVGGATIEVCRPTFFVVFCNDDMTDCDVIEFRNQSMGPTWGIDLQSVQQRTTSDGELVQYDTMRFTQVVPGRTSQSAVSIESAELTGSGLVDLELAPMSETEQTHQIYLPLLTAQ